MEIPSVSSQFGVTSTVVAQPIVQPQEQQARNLRSERERDEATRANDQVTLSGASRQVAARETERVVPQTEVSAAADKSNEKDNVEQARQIQIEARRNEQPVPQSVARALDAYTQQASLSSGS
jgi:hypothetical protein